MLTLTVINKMDFRVKLNLLFADPSWVPLKQQVLIILSLFSNQALANKTSYKVVYSLCSDKLYYSELKKRERQVFGNVYF